MKYLKGRLLYSFTTFVVGYGIYSYFIKYFPIVIGCSICGAVAMFFAYGEIMKSHEESPYH